MRTERVEVGLDPETRGKLEVVAARGSSVSELVRDLIERSHEEVEVAGAARLEAAERIGRMKVEDVPEPAELERQLSETHRQDRAP
jgi:putative NADH-flavin reductase